MVHRARKVGVRKGDPSEGSDTEDIPWSGFAIRSEKESWLRVDKSVPEAVEDNSGDIALRVEAGRSEQVGHLLADLPFVIRIRRRKEFGPSFAPLLGGWKSRLCEVDEEGEYSRQIRPNHGRVNPKLSHLSNFNTTSEPVKPIGAGDAHLRQESPVGDRNICRQVRRIVKPRIGTLAI